MNIQRNPLSNENSCDTQKIKYMSIPSNADVNHKTNVERINLFLAKQFLRSVLKHQDRTSQMPNTMAMIPNVPCTIVNSRVTSKTIAGVVQIVLKVGPMTATTVTKCRTTAEAMMIPCWRYRLLFFSEIAIISRMRTAICTTRLAVAAVREAMVTPIQKAEQRTFKRLL